MSMQDDVSAAIPLESNLKEAMCCMTLAGAAIDMQTAESRGELPLLADAAVPPRPPKHPGDMRGRPGHPDDMRGRPGHPGDMRGRPGHPGDMRGRPGHPGDMRGRPGPHDPHDMKGHPGPHGRPDHPAKFR